MKAKHYTYLIALCSCFSVQGPAHAASVYIDSLDGGFNIAQTFYAEGVGYRFSTDVGSYTLSSIDLSVVPRSPDPILYQGSIYLVGVDGLPLGPSLATATSVSDSSAFNPHAPYGISLKEFEFGSFLLTPNTSYIFVAGADSDVAYEVWGKTETAFERPAGGDWMLYSSSVIFYGDQWHHNNVDYLPGMLISATRTSAVPEPFSHGILGLAVIYCLVIKRRFF